MRADAQQSRDEVDLAVIGSGGAGMAAAIAARQAGASVVVIERGVLGGTCVNVGCVPSKTLLAAAGARHGAATNPFTGVPTSAGGVDLGALVAQKDELVAGMRQAKYADVASAYGFEVLPGHARLGMPPPWRSMAARCLPGPIWWRRVQCRIGRTWPGSPRSST